MEITLQILQNRLQFLNDQLHVYTIQGELDVVERLKKEIEQVENSIKELT